MKKNILLLLCCLLLCVFVGCDAEGSTRTESSEHDLKTEESERKDNRKEKKEEESEERSESTFVPEVVATSKPIRNEQEKATNEAIFGYEFKEEGEARLLGFKGGNDLTKIVHRSTKKEEESKEIVIREYDAEDYEGMDFTLESDELLFELDPETSQFKVTRKSDGKVWYSNPTEDMVSAYLVDTGGAKELQSTLVIEYDMVSGWRTVSNFESVLDYKLYTLEKMEDGEAIKVNYSIGKVKREYIIPLAVPEERFKVYYDKMDASLKRRADMAYRKLDINNLLATDNKKKLFALYPDLMTTNVYVLRESTKDHLKQKLEEEFATLGYSIEDYEQDCLYYPNAYDADNPWYNISVIYRINGNHLEVEVPVEEIEYKAIVPLTKISLFPYLGAESDSGDDYLFIQDGFCAVIEFQ